MLLMPALALLGGCRSGLVEPTDRSVYDLIADRQRVSLSATSDVHLGKETAEIEQSARMYRFNPRPLGPALPPEFRIAHPDPAPPADEEGEPPADHDEPPSPTPNSASIFEPDQLDDVVTLGLADALRYAMKHGRALQNAKEDLYFASLDLTLERHLWTPQFVASILAEADFLDGGELNDEDRAFRAVSDISLAQRLPHGGEVTARIVSTLLRDLDEHVAAGETGSLILQADIPLFRGAGRVAYESRYQAERELIYAVRSYERFRRSFLVDVASRYLILQQTKAAISNTYKSLQDRRLDWEKAEFKNRMGRSETVFEAPRAKSILRLSEAALVSAKERYESTLDQFKIFVGMSVEELLDVVDQASDEQSLAVDNLIPDIGERAAVDVALRYRLDLLTSADGVDDARRGVAIAKNRILPDLDFRAGVTMGTDPDRLNTFRFNTERADYRAAVELRLDDRKTERNAYRASLIAVRRAKRNHEEFADNVRGDARRALRRIRQQAELRQIQSLQVEENEFRLQAARAQFDLGQSRTNQDVVDAENDLLDARNEYARAIANYRISVLQFRLDTGTLWVADDGRLLADGRER